MNSHKKIIIVGGGMAGLTAAAYLTRNHFDVLILEKNERVGGLVGTFENKGFFFDSGPRAFVNSGIVKPILNDLGISYDFLENVISIGVEDRFFSIRSLKDLEAYRKILLSLYPENEADIDRITAVMTRLSEYTQVLYEFDNPNFVDLTSDKKFIFRKLIPWTFKFLNALRKFNQYSQPMEDYLRGQTANSSLIDILIQHFFRKMPTYFALGYFYVYLDYFYPKGGTGVLSNLLKEKILNQGGKILLNKTIVEIRPAESSVVDADGLVYPYDELIWAADLKTMYRCLNRAGLPPEVNASIDRQSAPILSARGAESTFILFLGVYRPPDYFAQRGGAHLFYSPSRQGLGRVNREDRLSLLADFSQKTNQEILAWLEDFIRLNTFEISIPALRDPALAPEGQTGLMVSCLFDYQILKKIEQAGWYDAFKSAMERLVIRTLSESIYEGLDQDILFQFSATPLTIEKLSGSSEGAITGWSFEAPPPVIHKLQDIPKSVLTPVPNLYQAGQWAYAPAGVPIAMLTGWYATQKIVNKWKKKSA